jgi:hypothetical protein
MLPSHFLFQHNKKTLIEPDANNKQILEKTKPMFCNKSLTRNLPNIGTNIVGRGEITSLVPIIYKFGWEGHICLVHAKNLKPNSRTRSMLGGSLILLRTFGSKIF